jgi:hypothetical protein
VRRLLIAVTASLSAVALAVPAQAAAGPVWDVRAPWGDTNLPPGGEGQFELVVANLGDQSSEEPLTITDELPKGVTVRTIHGPGYDCSLSTSTTVSCTLSGFYGEPFTGGESFLAGYLRPIFVDVRVAPGPVSPNPGTNVVRVQGGGDPTTPREHVEQIPFSSTPSAFGVAPTFKADVFSAASPFGEPVRQAGGHPFEQRVDLELDQMSAVGPDGTRYADSNGLARTVEVTLPRGFIGNPQATPKCDPLQFAEAGATIRSKGCPPDTQVGYINLALGFGREEYGQRSGGASSEGLHAFAYFPIYSLVPPRGQTADFAFDVQGFVQAHIYPTLDPARNYAIKVVTPNISDFFGFHVRASEVVFWGVPGDPAHDRYRYYQRAGEGTIGAPFGAAAIRPLLTEPSDCGVDNGAAGIRAESYEQPGVFSSLQEASRPLNVKGCDDPRFRFEPNVSLQPSDPHAGAPTGLEVNLRVPQRNDEAREAGQLYAQNGDVKGISTPPIKKTVVRLPEGMTLSPSAGQGLQGCSSAQIALGTDDPVRCPTSSQVGTLVMHTPLLPATEPMEGRVYIAAQNDNPFKTDFAMYLVIEQPERGLLVKVPGRIDLDPATGQITTTFDDLPQFQVSDFELKFKGGARAALVNPSTCGRKTMTAEFFSWQDPASPHVVRDSYEVAQQPDGSPCPSTLGQRPFSPYFAAGTVNPFGGAFSPLTVTVTRTDDEQEISQITTGLAPGLLAKLAGVAQCPEAGIAQAQAPGRSGTEELSSPSCPAASQIGSTFIGAGVGSTLTYVPGKVYFAGPYRGAPFSLVVITPAVVGPYDLGVVAVRSALYIDPHTAQATAVTDPLPLIFKGIPVRLRDVRVTIDRSEFTFNPTNCQEQHVTGTITSELGAIAPVSDRFQVADCASLQFKPDFKASVSGRSSRANGASLTARIVNPATAPGSRATSQAGFARVKVELPRQLPSRLTTLQQACLASVFDANPAACPAASVVGHAKVITPVLPVPLEGPAYFVSHGGEAFPSLTMVLQGYGVTVELVGTTFINKAGVTSTTFKTVPDVPFNTFELTLPQGRYSALTALGHLCTQKLRMPTEFLAQNGLVIHRSTPIGVTGCAKKKALSRKQKLAAALKACRHKQAKGKRVACERRARKRYGPVRAGKRKKS